MYRQELKATVPREILECPAVSREINFTSKQEIRCFRLEQRVFLAGACIEGKAGDMFYPPSKLVAYLRTEKIAL